MIQHNKLTSLLCLILVFTVVSCGESFKNMSGLNFGSTQTEAENDLKKSNISVISNKGFFVVDKVDYLDVKWSYLRADFTEDYLSEVKYVLSHSDTISAHTFSSLKNAIIDHYNNYKIDKESQEECILSDSTCIISLSFFDCKDLILLYKDIPSKAEIERRKQLALTREKDIDDKLQRLNDAIIEYTKCLDSDPYNMREHYVKEVTSMDNYLKNHIDDMTPRQKEWYQQLQNVTL